jgi:prepilin-type N-terminal cleavage/methylation domain-containing protein/prepilin-type processing-associated H-X9-DG protein
MNRRFLLHSARTGFTLIELLVVIAIIAILAAILFPVFAQAREKARSASCVSNVKQINTAIAMYTQDYDECLVPWYQLSNVPNDQYAAWAIGWVELVAPYVKNGAPVKPALGYTGPVDALGVFKCPSWSADKYLKGAGATYCWGSPANVTWVPGSWYHATYGIGFGGGPNGGCTEAWPHENWAGSNYNTAMSLAAINRPAETAEVSDGVTVVKKSSPGANAGWWMTMGCEAAEIHAGGGNFGFIDGHVKWVARNAERYLATDANGCVYKRYMSVDK